MMICSVYMFSIVVVNIFFSTVSFLYICNLLSYLLEDICFKVLNLFATNSSRGPNVQKIVITVFSIFLIYFCTIGFRC